MIENTKKARLEFYINTLKVREKELAETTSEARKIQLKAKIYDLHKKIEDLQPEKSFFKRLLKL